jgi:hypothetical protein
LLFDLLKWSVLMTLVLKLGYTPWLVDYYSYQLSCTFLIINLWSSLNLQSTIFTCHFLHMHVSPVFCYHAIVGIIWNTMNWFNPNHYHWFGFCCVNVQAKLSKTVCQCIQRVMCYCVIRRCNKPFVRIKLHCCCVAVFSTQALLA